MTSFRIVVTVLFLSLVPMGLADAQTCLGGDGLDSGACCSPVPLNLPTPLPPVSMTAQGICWNACGLASQSCLSVNVQAPVPGPVCGEYSVPMQVFDCSGIQLLQGSAQLTYLRTWDETSVPGTIDTQVWRFALKADLAGSFGSTPVCPVPTCLGPEPQAFFYGYLDYAFDCVNSTFENAIVLYHACDAFIHKPGLSSRPGSYHPFESYAIVGPDTTANPFVPAFNPPASGNLVGEAVRSAQSPVSGLCSSKEFVFNGALQPFFSLCLCPLAFGPAQQTLSVLNGSGVCGTTFSSLNVYPTVPWFELVTTSIGTWTTTNSYPGPEETNVAEGLFFYTDVCDPTGTGTVQQTVDIFYGGITDGGYPVLPNPVFQLTQTFVDLASNYSANFPGTIPLPLFGSVGPTDHLIYVNAQ